MKTKTYEIKQDNISVSAMNHYLAQWAKANAVRKWKEIEEARTKVYKIEWLLCTRCGAEVWHKDKHCPICHRKMEY